MSMGKWPSKLSFTERTEFPCCFLSAMVPGRYCAQFVGVWHPVVKFIEIGVAGLADSRGIREVPFLPQTKTPEHSAGPGYRAEGPSSAGSLTVGRTAIATPQKEPGTLGEAGSGDPGPRGIAVTRLGPPGSRPWNRADSSLCWKVRRTHR